MAQMLTLSVLAAPSPQIQAAEEIAGAAGRAAIGEKAALEGMSDTQKLAHDSQAAATAANELNLAAAKSNPVVESTIQKTLAEAEAARGIAADEFSTAQSEFERVTRLLEKSELDLINAQTRAEAAKEASVEAAGRVADASAVEGGTAVDPELLATSKRLLEESKASDAAVIEASRKKMELSANQLVSYDIARLKHDQLVAATSELSISDRISNDLAAAKNKNRKKALLYGGYGALGFGAAAITGAVIASN